MELHITEHGREVMAELLGWVRDACAQLPPALLDDAADTFRAVARGMDERTSADEQAQPDFERRSRR